jgi:hypothetical protein
MNMIFEAESIQHLLLDLLKPGEMSLDSAGIEAISTNQWQALLDLAAEQRVRPLLFHRIKENQFLDVIPEYARKTLHDFYRFNALQNMRFYGELHNIADALREASIPVIVLKGAYLTQVVYPNIALREMNDLDLLVMKGDLAPAAELIMDMGYQPHEPLSLDWDPYFRHLPRFVKPNVAGVDLHWTITIPEIETSFEIEDFWESAQPVKIANNTMLGLSPEDVLLYLCYHVAFGHAFAFGLRPSCDIQAVLSHFSTDLCWDKVIERAKRWGWERGVYLAFKLAVEYLGTKIPPDVLNDLKPAQDTERIYRIAKIQTFSDKTLALEINPNLAAYTQMSNWEKVIVLLKRLFPSRVEMASIYQIPPDSIRILLKYPVRWRDVILRHIERILGFMKRDDEGTQAAQRQGEIWGWISAGDTAASKK